LVYGVDASAKQARTARLEVVNSAANLVNAALSIGLKFDTNVKIRDEIECGELIEKVATINGVHAAKDDIAVCNGANGDGVEKCAGIAVYDCPEAHRSDRAGGDIYFEATLSGIVYSRIQDAIEILLFNAIWVDKH